MTVEIGIFLFGKPAWEIDELEGNRLDEGFANKLRELADNLRSRLLTVARAHELLVRNGWRAEGGLYDLMYYKDISEEDARKELENLGILDVVDYIEEIEEEFEEIDEEETAEEVA